MRLINQDGEQEGVVSLEKAKQLHAEGDEHESSGNPTKALESYRQVKAAVADYPDIDNDIERAEQAADLLSDFGGDLFTSEDDQVELDQFN